MDWSWLVDFGVSPGELVLRGTVMYWLLFLVFRFVLRRDVGGIGVADVLFVVLVADASQNAMTGGYRSVGEGAVLVGTLVVWNALLDWLAFRFKAAARFLEPPAVLLVRNGRLLQRNLRAEMITRDELQGHLREHGIESFAAVKAAWLESDGQFSVIKLDDAESGPPRKHRPA